MKTHYHVIVVGAGSSGLMAAIQAGRQGAQVLLIEKNKRPGRKLLLSGGGRCNVTNRTSKEELIHYIPGNGKFLYSALQQFDQEDIISFFEEKGVALKEEDHGRMFPVTDSARTILDTLLTEAKTLGIDFLYGDPVDRIVYDFSHKKVIGVETKSGKKLNAASVILAVGGRAYPKTGASGDGYAWARTAGHTIARLYPTEAPLLSDDPWIKDRSLMGVSLRNIQITLWDNKKRVLTRHQMDMIFTHFGYSGPAILRTSGHVNLWLFDHPESPACMTLDILPNVTIDALQSAAEKQRDKQWITILKQWMPEKMGYLILRQANIPPETAFKQSRHQDNITIFNFIKAFPLTAKGSQPIEKGFVTGGGVTTSEVNPATMESKKIAGLYFCGELLDINGYTGGYNITAAFVTGAVAGQHAAWSSFE